MQVIVNRNLLEKKMVSTMLELGRENGLHHVGIRETGHGQTMKICDRNIVMKRRCCKKCYECSTIRQCQESFVSL